jgi:hypothetical protein
LRPPRFSSFKDIDAVIIEEHRPKIAVVAPAPLLNRALKRLLALPRAGDTKVTGVAGASAKIGRTTSLQVYVDI